MLVRHQLERVRNIGIMPTSMPAQNHHHRAGPLLHRHQLQDRRKCTTAPPRWTGWCRSRSAESRSPRGKPPASGATTASTSSTLRDTSISHRSRALASRLGRRGRGLLRGRRRRAAIRNRVRQADKYRVPRIAFINKMDRVGAEFERVVQEMRDKLKASRCCSILPIGAEEKFTGIVDLVDMKALILGRRSSRRQLPGSKRSRPI